MLGKTTQIYRSLRDFSIFFTKIVAAATRTDYFGKTQSPILSYLAIIVSRGCADKADPIDDREPYI
jgi:hypothetical protein